MSPTICSRFSLLLFLALPTDGAEVDAAIKAAPVWPCFQHGKNVPEQVIWKSSYGGRQSGALSVGNGKMLLGASDFKDGIMTALDTSGRMLWQARHPSLNSRIHDYGQAIKSVACFDGDRAYYVSNRGELVCLDLDGFRDDINDRPFKGEERVWPEDADFVWKIDMMKELGVYKRDHSDVGNTLPSPLVLGDLVFCVTAHGIPSGKDRGASPDAGRANPSPPSFLAVHKLTGEIAWSSNAPNRNIAYCQWSSPVLARVNGADQVIFPGGDGVLYGFEPTTGRLLWQLDCNRPGALDRHAEGYRWNQLPEARFGFVAKPVVHGDMLFVSLNESIEQPQSLPLLAIHLAESDGQPKVAWQFNGPGFHGTLGDAAVDNGLVFVIDAKCILFALDMSTGAKVWEARLAEDAMPMFVWPVVYQGLVYASGETTVAVFAATREKKCLGSYDLGDVCFSVPQFADGQMFVASGYFVYALKLPE